MHNFFNSEIFLKLNVKVKFNKIKILNYIKTPELAGG